MARESGVQPKEQLTDPELAALAISVGFSPTEAVPGLSDSEAVVAVAVALAEDRGRTGRTSATGDRGVWQINMASHPSYDRERLKEPEYNGGAAFDISGGGSNWRPWTTFRRGLYRPFLARARAAVAAPASGGGGFSVDVPGLPPIGTDTLSPITDPLSALNALGDALTDPNTWRRAGLVAGGVILLALGFVAISKDSLLATAKTAIKAVAPV